MSKRGGEGEEGGGRVRLLAGNINQILCASPLVDTHHYHKQYYSEDYFVLLQSDYVDLCTLFLIIRFPPPSS